MPYPGWSPKLIRMYKHITARGGSKSMAAATVNAFKGRSKAGKRRKGK